MYSKFDLSSYKMSFMRCWLPTNSLTSVNDQEFSSFQVYMKLFHFQLKCMRKTLQLKNLLGKHSENFDPGIVKKLRKYQY